MSTGGEHENPGIARPGKKGSGIHHRHGAGEGAERQPVGRFSLAERSKDAGHGAMCSPRPLHRATTCTSARNRRHHQHLGGPWAGWRMAGRVLVSPDGDRITPERLRGLLWRHTLEQRRDEARSRREKRVTSGEVTTLRARNSELSRRKPRLRRSGGSP